MQKINDKLGTPYLELPGPGDTPPVGSDSLSLTVEQVQTDFFSSILDDGDDGLEDIFDQSLEKLLERPRAGPSFSCYVTGCEMAEFKFSSSAQLRTHQRESHPALYCQTCHSTSSTESEAQTHNCNKRHKCGVCERMFATSNELLHHSYIHTGEKPHVCHLCGKEFRQRATLDRHKLTHEERREHECEVCGKKFKHKHYLASHKMLHDGVKPHICSWCGLRFTQNSNLQKHVRQKHMETRDFVCRLCGKGFVQPYYLRRHMKSHKDTGMEDTATFDFIVASAHSGSDEQCGIRVLACSLCPVTCKGPAELERHRAKHHPPADTE